VRRLIVLLKNLFSAPMRLFSKISVFSILQFSEVDVTSAVCSGAKIYRTTIGKYSYIGRSTFVTNTKIGNFCSIAGGCNIGGTSHTLNWVSTSSVFHRWNNVMKKNFARFEYDIFQETEIGNDVWIATNAMIKAGVKISNGAVIGMGSVVTRDIGPYEIWAGNPARMVRKRFDDETIEKLEKIKWWDWEDKIIEEYANCFNNPLEFISKVEALK